MAWHIQYLQDQQIILVKNTGELTLQDFKDEAGKLAVLVEETRVCQILCDDIEMHSSIGTVDIYEFPNLYHQAGLSRKSRIAVLISPDDTGITDFKFYETVCLNRGYQSRIFFSYEEALAWLKGV